MSDKVRLDQLIENPDNPRLDLGNVTDLAASIAVQGVLQALLVMPMGDGTYMVIDGHRRHAAMQSINYAGDVPVRVTKMDRSDRICAAISAGAHTVRLRPIEKARGYAQLRDELGLTQKEIAKRCGCSIITVNTTLRMLELDKATIARVEAGTMSAQSAIALARQLHRRPQGRKKAAYVPNPNACAVDLKLCITVGPSTDTAVLGRDVAAWFEAQHAAGAVPHGAHILSVDDWSASQAK